MGDSANKEKAVLSTKIDELESEKIAEKFNNKKVETEDQNDLLKMNELKESTKRLQEFATTMKMKNKDYEAEIKTLNELVISLRKEIGAVKSLCPSLSKDKFIG